jgi:hypothetical protein
MSQQESAGVPCSRIYRHLHGTPMLAGVPVQVLLVLLAFGLVGGFGLTSVSKLAGLGVVGLAVIVWLVVAFACGQDRVVVSLFLIRLRTRMPRVIACYTRGYRRVVFEDEEGGR